MSLDTWLALGGHGIGIAVGAVGLYYAWNAGRQANRARHAANRARQAVKRDSDKEVMTKAKDELQSFLKTSIEVSYTDASALFRDITGRVRRIIARQEKNKILKEPIRLVKDALKAAGEALKGVQPSNPADNKPSQVVYNAIEGPFTDLLGCLADFCGHLDR
jgi:hypothetical protein